VLDTLLHSGGYLGIFICMVLTGCGMPVPEEVFIIGSGILAANGELRPELAFVACLLGALVGDAAMYGIGHRYGHSLLNRHPMFSKLLGAQREEYFERAVQRHGFKVLLLARFMVGVRGPVYLAAGVVRMPFLKFLLWDLVCATLVVGAFFSLAFFFGEEIADLLIKTERGLTVIVLTGIAVTVAFVALRRYRRRLLEQVIVNAGEAPTAEEVELAEAQSVEAEKREAS
jgi:membrane protein DedA with SNARE-associated domain